MHFLLACSKKGASLMSVGEALAIMIAFGSFTATIIFGILNYVKNNKK